MEGEGKEAHWMPPEACDLLIQYLLWCKTVYLPCTAMACIYNAVMQPEFPVSPEFKKIWN